VNSRYEIRVKGIFDGRWTTWFEDLQGWRPSTWRSGSGLGHCPAGGKLNLRMTGNELIAVEAAA
jgi:hypothetical protein